MNQNNTQKIVFIGENKEDCWSQMDEYFKDKEYLLYGVLEVHIRKGCKTKLIIIYEKPTLQEMFKNAKGFDPVFGINKEYTDEEVKEIFANVPKIKDTKDMFVGVDWEEQQKGVDKVKETIKDWKAPNYNLSGMFSGRKAVTLEQMSETEYFKSEEFKNSARKQIEEDTWGQDLPMIYTDKNGDMVKHFKDGTIKIIKYGIK